MVGLDNGSPIILSGTRTPSTNPTNRKAPPTTHGAVGPSISQVLDQTLVPRTSVGPERVVPAFGAGGALEHDPVQEAGFPGIVEPHGEPIHRLQTRRTS